MFLLILLLIGLHQGCTYTPVEWLSHKPNQTGTLCNVGWLELLGVNVAQMKIKENQLWVVVAQQYIAASLNAARTGFVKNISESILFLGNTLEYRCDNISLWSLQEKEEEALATLDKLNHGLFPEFPSCDLVSIATQSEETFFYYQNIDTFIVRDYEQNQTISRSEYQGIYNANVILSLSLGFSIFCMLICFLKLVIDGNARKRYRLWKSSSSSTSLGESSSGTSLGVRMRGDQNIELSSDDSL